METLVRVLAVITAVYAVVLVLVLTVALLTILFYLRRIGGTFAQIATLMRAVETATTDLNVQLERVHKDLTAVAESLDRTAEHLGAAPMGAPEVVERSQVA
uniref:DUF948 domain-containing protein n=1 Tax=Thermomicrobium roseum TaxID=500 RepID=A0A7C1K1L0_THERO